MNKLDECYIISREIINKYIELICLPIYTISTDIKRGKINEIKTLLKEEYKIIHSMSSVDVKLCFEKIETNEDDYNKSVLSRIKNRLSDYTNVLEGDCITTSELGMKNIPQDRVFSSYEVILSMINIETLKRMKNKIYALKPSCDKDIRFVNALKKQIEMSKLTFLYSGSISELIALYNNDDIGKIPTIDINKIRNRNIRNINLNTVITSTVAVYTRKIIDMISNMQKLNNNSDDVFDYLSLITRLEVLLNYMDKNTLNMVNDYCKNISNRASMVLAKKLIKEKLDSLNH